MGLADEALSNRGRTDWAHKVEKKPNDPRIKDYVFGAGKPKCNLFVADMLYNVGITPPLTIGGGWKGPITARMWTGSVAGWEKVSTQQKGDIVSNGIHCGIAVDGTYTVAAGREKVYMDKDITGTIQRYEG